MFLRNILACLITYVTALGLAGCMLMAGGCSLYQPRVMKTCNNQTVPSLPSWKVDREEWVYCADGSAVLVEVPVE
jgi:hypothetical protein